MVWTADPRGEVTFVNKRWEEYTGSGRGAGGDWGGGLIHPEDSDEFRAAWRHTLAVGAEVFAQEFRLRRAADGEYRWMLAVAVALYDEAGAIAEWVGTLTDIDDQKRHTQILEGLVQERTAELQRSNEELEKFAYIASHDLQEPLRKIQAFGDRLRTKCRDQLPETGKEYVDRMNSAAARMRRLIDDLLTFSRVTTQRRPPARLNLRKLVAEVLSDLEERLAQAKGTVRVGALPPVEADPTQMRQLFQNLLVNAVKFHRPGVPPVVEVEGDTVEQPAEGGGSVRMCRISVRDNGIGFDEKYRERIFDVFQRLHGRTEYEGTGVGLAICRKIVERHGGTITAHGREGEGATFVVLLPAPEQPTREAKGEDGRPEQAHHDPAGRR
jgi:PAS domain S-box-containing protein